MQYMNDMAGLFSQIDGVHYDWNNPEQMEKRLLEGTQSEKVSKQQTKPQAQPVKQPRIKTSRLGLIVSGFDVDF
jgi:hypothetical protein